MNVRTIPFGYKYDTGRIVIDENTSGIIKEIFSQYINGKSLLNIASLLNNMHIEYRPGVVGWNKARIKRIIEDKRYLGNEDYPPIIDKETADKANNIKAKRNTLTNINKDSLIYQLDAVVHCPCCGAVMKRLYEPRNKIHERWICQNSECRKIIPLSDVELLSEIQTLLNAVVSNPDVVQRTESESKVNIEEIRIENEINRILNSTQIHRTELIDKILESASIKYSNLDTTLYESQRLRDIFRAQQCAEEFPLKLFNQTVSTISFDTQNNITITLINKQTFGKESIHGTAEKENNGYRAESNSQRGRQEQISTEARGGVLPCINAAGRTA